MKTLHAFGLCLLLSGAAALAQNADDDPRDGTLVQCGDEKIAIFGGTESSDGHYALGWTVRPSAHKPAVDWSSYDRTDATAWITKYPMDDDMSSGDYAVVDGILDLEGKTFAVLASKEPYFPHKNHGDLHAAWSGKHAGGRYLIAHNDRKWDTANLWLADINPKGIRITDLTVAADKTVHAFLRKRTPKNYADYAVQYAPGGSVGQNKPAANPFDGDSVKIVFDAAVPKSDTTASYDGKVTADVRTGKVKGVNGKKTE